MRWYKVIACDRTVKNPMVCNFNNLAQYGYDEYSFKYGKYIENWNEDIFMQAKDEDHDGNPDDALQNHLMLPIYSANLVKKLKEANIEGIQYLPIKILRPKGEVIEGFYIANFLNFIEAFDYEKSKFSVFGDDYHAEIRGKIAGVTKHVLKRAKLEEFDIIRLKEKNLSFFVSEKFKKLFTKNKFTGYSFKEVELS